MNNKNIPIYRKLNKKVRTLKLPSSVYEEGVGEESLFTGAKLLGYRQKSCSRTKLYRLRSSLLPVYGRRGGVVGPAGGRAKFCHPMQNQRRNIIKMRKIRRGGFFP